MTPRGDTGRWGGSLGLVLLGHGLVVAALIGGVAQAPLPEAPPVAMLIDLTPAAEPPPRPVQPMVEPAPVPVPQPKPTPRPKPKTVKLSPPTAMPSQSAALEAAEPQASPEPAAQPSAPATTAPSPQPAPGPAATSWQGRLLAHLERHKRYPGAARFRRQQGVAGVAFSMDRQGRLLAVRLRTSSGVESLDEESLDLLRRAQPLPPPPPEVEGERLDLVVPVEFFLSRR